MLVRKNDGLLYCPDDVRGADSVTLSEANARSAGRARRGRLVRDSGARDRSGASTTALPDGILTNALTGYWSHRDLLLGNGVRVMRNIPNIVKTEKRGDLISNSDSTRPAYDGDVTITYTGASVDHLVTPALTFVEGGATAISIWCVGGWTDPTDAAQDCLFHLTDVSGFVPYSQVGRTNGIFLAIQAGVVSARLDDATDGSVIATYAISDTNLHLFEVRMTSTALLLFVDGAQVASTAFTSTAAIESTLSYLYTGVAVSATGIGNPTVLVASHDGPMNEVVIYPAAVTDDEATDMNAYYARSYPGLTIS